MFRARYDNVYQGDEKWQAIKVTGSDTYGWSAGSTYVQNPPYFEGMTMTPAPVGDIRDARPLAVLGDSITRSEEHTSELQSLMRTSYAVFCLKNKKQQYKTNRKKTRSRTTY